MKIYIQLFLFFVSTALVCNLQAQTNERFSAPSVNQKHKDFLGRTSRNLINIDFIIANALGQAKHAVNEGREPADTIISDGTTPVTNSIIIQPGVDADGVTIININEGDGTAISR